MPSRCKKFLCLVSGKSCWMTGKVLSWSEKGFILLEVFVGPHTSCMDYYIGFRTDFLGDYHFLHRRLNELLLIRWGHLGRLGRFWPIFVFVLVVVVIIIQVMILRMVVVKEATWLKETFISLPQTALYVEVTLVSWTDDGWTSTVWVLLWWWHLNITNKPPNLSLNMDWGMRVGLVRTPSSVRVSTGPMEGK